MIVAALALATLVAYQPAWHGEPVWDDDRHLTRPDLESVHGLWRIWSDLGTTPQYYPVVHTAFWLLHRAGGGDTLVHHLAGISLHVIAAVLIGVILRRLRVPGAYLAAAIFALHPVHVESVAWMAELKNTLSGVLYLTAALDYLRFDDSRRARPYVVALVCFVLALLTKTVTATLPAALCVVFWWLRGRLSWRRDLLPLLPFFAASLGAGLLTIWLERTQVGALGPEFQLSAIDRVQVAGRAIWFYLVKLLWPVNLTFIYPRWRVDGSQWWQYLFPLGVLGLIFGLWLLRRRSRAPLAAFLIFCGTLFPALGFFNVFPFRYSFVADHFQYLANVSVIALAAAAAATLARRWRLSTTATTAGVLAIAVPLAVLTWRQSRQFAGAETLYRTTIERNPEAWLAHNNLGAAKLYGSEAELDAAVAHLERAVALAPHAPEPRENLGIALQRRGKFFEAAAQHREAVRLRPGFAEAHDSLGTALRRQGQLDAAIAAYREAIRIRPDYFKARNNLGAALVEAGRLDEAVPEYEEALRISPGAAMVENNLGLTLLQLGRVDEAAPHLKSAAQRDAQYAMSAVVLGDALQQMGRPEDAVRAYISALPYQSPQGRAIVENKLGIALVKLGRAGEAVEHFAEAVRLAPGFTGARENLERARKLLSSKF